MAELIVSQEHIIALRARAQGLDPVVLLGAAGLSAGALKEIDRALQSHGLVKVRGGRSERAEREALFRDMAQALAAARIQLIGNTFVLFRPIPAEEAPPSRPAVRTAPPRGAAKKPPAKAPRAGAAAAPPKRGVIRGAAPRSSGPAGFGSGIRTGAPAPARRRAPAGGTRQR